MTLMHFVIFITGGVVGFFLNHLSFKRWLEFSLEKKGWIEINGIKYLLVKPKEPEPRAPFDGVKP